MVWSRGAAVLLLLGVLLAGCRWGGHGVPDAHLPSAHVGSLVHRWAESDEAEAPGVRAMQRKLTAPQLITDSDTWRRFMRDLPPGLRAADARRDLERVDLRNAVVVVAAYGKCTEVSHLEDRGDAELAFVVTSNPRVNCAWSPTQLEVWQVDLDALGVTDASQVHLVD